MQSYLSAIKQSNFVFSSSILLRCIITGTVTSLVIWKLMKRAKRRLGVQERAVVVITGCDSGLGYSMALHCREVGYYVLAGVLSDSSAGAKALTKLKNESGNISVVKLDVTNSDDIKKAVTISSAFLEDNPQYYLHCVINNAGVMIFGEYEWLTDEMVFKQLNINVLGAMYVTKEFLPLLRKHKGRIINVSSHCAETPLPGLSVYAASKSGLQAWNDAIRVEYKKYGIKVISFVPGSFFLESNILSRQTEYADQMKATMTQEAIEFYGNYFDEYQAYLRVLAGEKPLQRLQNEKLYGNLSDALLSDTPASSYHITPFRYSIYHILFKITPVSIRDYLVERFMQMPAYKKCDD